MAGRLSRIQESFYLDKTRSYSFGLAVKGEKAIADYVSLFSKNYKEGFAAFDIAEEMKSKNRRADLQIVSGTFTKASFVVATGLVTAYLSQSLTMGQAAFAAAGVLMTLAPSKSAGRLMSHWVGDERYRRLVPPASFSLNFESLAQNGIDPEANVFAEIPFSLTQRAFEQLRKGADDRMREMRRSCLVHSPSAKCDENIAVREILHMNDHGFFGGFIKTVQDQMDSNRVGFVVKGRIAFLRYREKGTREPILMHWIQFDLVPRDSGISRRKKSEVEQEERSLDWDGGLEPALAPIRR